MFLTIPSSPRHGFTLIELSLVLVIIGLLVGGIMTGTDLVRAATVRGQIRQMTDIETQMQAFRDKYFCFPGDCTNATSIFGATWSGNTISNGDGDHLLRITSNASTTTAGDCLSTDPNSGGTPTGELGQFFLQLDAAGLGSYKTDGQDPFVGVGFPYSILNSSLGIMVSCLRDTSGIFGAGGPANLRSGNILVVGLCPNNAGGCGGRMGYRVGLTGVGAAWLASRGIDSLDAKNIDNKLDDDNPSQGRMGVIGGCVTGTNSYMSGGTSCNVTFGRNLGQ